MSKSFEESYKAEIGKNIPDLWDRIVAGIEADETEQYAAFHEEQQKLDETKILMEIYEATEMSYKAEEASYEAMKTSCEAEEASYEAEKSSCEAEEASYETEESSYEAEETPYQEEEVKEVSSKVVSWKKHFRRLMPVAAAACILGVFVIPATILLVRMAGMKSMDNAESAPDMMMDAAAEENYTANTQAGEAEDKFTADNMLTGNLSFKDDYDAGAMEDKRSEEGMVAGSDSGGGAGIQADLRTFHAFRVYGCSVITSVTAQNPDKVSRIDVLPVDAVTAQLETVLEAFPIRFAKTGMLANREIVEAVADSVQKYALPLIIDPVMVSTSGTRLLEESAISAMQEKLFPLAKWITPNIPEAELICGRKLTTTAELAESAQMISEKYRCSCLLKSGHAITSDQVTDIICDQGKLFALRSPAVKIEKNAAHGTGCTLSAALTAGFALEENWQNVLRSAKAFVFGSLRENIRLSSSLSQMYPPEKNYFNQVSLNEL